MALPHGLARGGLGRADAGWPRLRVDVVCPIHNDDGGVRGVLNSDRLVCDVLALQVGGRGRRRVRTTPGAALKGNGPLGGPGRSDVDIYGQA